MAKYNLRKGERVTLIFYMLFTLVTPAFVLSYIDYWSSTMAASKGGEIWGNAELSIWVTLTYVAMGLSRLFRAFRERSLSRMQYFFHLISGAILLACAILVFVLGNTREVTIAIVLVFLGVLAVGRVLSMVRNHRWWNILLNIILILMLGLIAIASSVTPEIVFIATMATAAIVAILSMMEIIFSRIRLDILKEIVQQTYIVEILLGLLLLMIAFSFALRLTDEAFPTFWDGFWYCFAVVTTIGFGDITATSIWGRAMTMVLGVYGIVVVALLTSVIVNFYGEMKKVKTHESAGEGEPPKQTGA